MPHSPLARFVALSIALAGAFAVPVSAVAHGMAHSHEATGHAEPDLHSVAGGRAAAPTDARAHIALVVESLDGGAGNHPHESVVAAVTAKGVAAPMAVVAAGVTLQEAPEGLITTVQPEAAAGRSTNLALDAPPRLRAPPQVFQLT